MSETCFVCCESYNRSTRTKIVCNLGDCGYECCKSCIRAYLLSTRNDPHCMNCKRAYTQNFMVTFLNRSFTDNDFKKHRRKLLLEHELSRMPETMQLAENYKQIDECNESIKEFNEQITELNKQLRSLQAKKFDMSQKIYRLKTGKTESDEERKKFVFPCPADDCRGYLSTQYKCGYCNLYTCPKCHEIIGDNRDDPHTCNPDSIASAEEIKKTCKGCPSCGVPIQKISGCDQMYCTECRIAFSWNTGKIDNTGLIHNPHFYQQQQQENNGQAPPRNPQDILCGGLINYYQFNHIRRKIHSLVETTVTAKIRETRKKAAAAAAATATTATNPEIIERVGSLDQTLNTIHRLVNHITNNDLPRLRQRVRELDDNRMLRAEYINKKRSQEELALAVYRNDIQRKKTIDRMQIDELLSVVGIENFTNLYNSKHTGIAFVQEVEQFIATYRNLVHYTNREMKLISITYNHSVMIIDEETFAMNNKKYLKADLPRILQSTNGAGTSTDPM